MTTATAASTANGTPSPPQNDTIDTVTATATDMAMDVPKQRAGKRKVALFVGYEGTGYRGLQIQQQTDPTIATTAATDTIDTSNTIEHCLEAAIFAAGGILPSNMGSLKKLSWSRSSRTDKSVHSLATVISMKMECSADVFELDPCGTALADAINTHLPPEIRVFGVQRVTKSFDARNECIRRLYHYYLPASVLGIEGEGTGEGGGTRPEDEEILSRLRAAWQLFDGYLPFHNFTKRKLYRQPSMLRSNWRKKGRGGGGGERQDAEQEGGAEEEMDESMLSTETETETDTTETTETETEVETDEEGGEAKAKQKAERKNNSLKLEWYDQKNESDPVTRRHFRFIDEVSIGDNIAPIAPGGPPCIRLTIKGGSFMLHQIRHMVGASIAVAVGKVPLEVVEASLTVPSRTSFPLAPASTLVLAGAEFSPFRLSWDGAAPHAAATSGDRLVLGAAGVAAQEAFAADRLLPAVSGLLEGEEWEAWRGGDLDRIRCDEEEVDAFVGKFREYRKRGEDRREERRRAEAEAEAQGKEAVMDST